MRTAVAFRLLSLGLLVAGLLAPASPPVEAASRPATHHVLATRPAHHPLHTSRPRFAPAVPTNSPVGYIPCDITNAYRLGGLTGGGETIAVLDPFDQPTIATDLTAFDQAVGLPDPPSFSVLKPFGTVVAPDPGFEFETTLDVEWAHAAAPGAAIVLVEMTRFDAALPPHPGDILSVLDYTVHNVNPDVVSMSFGIAEGVTGLPDLGTEQGFDAFLPPTNGAGQPIAYVASAGDAGFYGPNDPSSPSFPSWPATSPNAIAVGGTSLSPAAFGYTSAPPSHLNCSGATSPPGVNPSNETVWGGAFCPGTNVVCGTGGGLSYFEPTPGWQGMAFAGSRAVPDVAMLGDPATGVATLMGGQWNQFSIGGTSLSAPLWAGVVAALDQGRRAAGLPNLNQTGSSHWAYSTSAADFNDVTTGSAPNTLPGDPCLSGACVAKPGYDEVTGRGSPNFPALARDIAGAGAPHTVGGNLTPVSPVRIMDTRSGIGGVPVAPMRSQQTIHLAIPSPANGSQAVVVNMGVTNTNGMSSGWLLASPCGQARPFASTVNFTGGQTIAVLTQVAIGGCGLDVYLNTAGDQGTADAFVDLEGYYSLIPSGAVGLYNPLSTPFRALDSRTPIGGHQARFQAGEAFPLQVADGTTVPADAKAVTLNLTGVSPSADTYLTVYPAQAGATTCPTDPTSIPRKASNLNLPAGDVHANRVTVQVGDSGRICFFNVAATVDVIADLAGWFSGGLAGDQSGLLFSAWSPVRVYDSRPVGRLPGGTSNCPSVNFQLPVPPAVSALSYSLTGLDASTGTYLLAYPTGNPPNPPTSDINFNPGQVRPNLVITRVGAGHSITICNANGATDFFVDVNGVYRP
jgi:Subtilase family